MKELFESVMAKSTTYKIVLFIILLVVVIFVAYAYFTETVNYLESEDFLKSIGLIK